MSEHSNTKLPIQYICAECLNFLKRTLMYCKTVIFTRKLGQTKVEGEQWALTQFKVHV